MDRRRFLSSTAMAAPPLQAQRGAQPFREAESGGTGSTSYSPELTVDLVDKMNAACGLNLIKPKFLNSASAPKVKQKGMFD